MAEKEMPVGPAARFFEDFSEGDEFVTQGRTLTETDLMSWAMFTGDMNSMHVDEDFASEYGLFGGRFPPGLMAVAIASGLWERLGLTAGTGLAILEQTVRYKSIIRIGDTIHVVYRVDKLEFRPGKASGKIFWHYDIVKGDGEIASEGDWLMLVKSRKE